LIIFACILDLAFYKVVPEISYSVTYASGTASALLLFLLGITVFYTGEALHRDRELKILPVLWSAPIPNTVLLLSKYLSTILLTLSFIVVVGLLALMVQLLRGHTPIDLSAYFLTYGVILVPSIVFITALVMTLNVLLRNKYLAYVVAVDTGAGLLYLYNIGYNHWLYNPLLYRSWKYTDLTSPTTLGHRLYWLGLAVVCLALAHILFERKSR
jgi:ABC-type transport system involved in multi-copper enzyme maturation permease subunit